MSHPETEREQTPDGIAAQIYEQVALVVDGDEDSHRGLNRLTNQLRSFEDSLGKSASFDMARVSISEGYLCIGDVGRALSIQREITDPGAMVESWKSLHYYDHLDTKAVLKNGAELASAQDRSQVEGAVWAKLADFAQSQGDPSAEKGLRDLAEAALMEAPRPTVPARPKSPRPNLLGRRFGH